MAKINGKNNKNDKLIGSAKSDILKGFSGNDRLRGGLGHDTLDGGSGFDTADYTDATGKVSVNLATGKASGSLGKDKLISIEAIVSGKYNDTLYGDKFNNTIDASGGNDYLSGGFGKDSLTGGKGSDKISFDLSDVSVYGGYKKLTNGDKAKDVFILEDSATKKSSLSSLINDFESAFDILDLSKLSIARASDIKVGYSKNIAKLAIKTKTATLKFNMKILGSQLLQSNFLYSKATFINKFDVISKKISFAKASGKVLVNLQTDNWTVNKKAISLNGSKDVKTISGSAYNDYLVCSETGNILNGESGNDILRGAMRLIR